ncbi:MAG: FtsW/RodA/SpoVE family cell cycle protein, partial [Candidatus Nealsonbacteria bacterium]
MKLTLFHSQSFDWPLLICTLLLISIGLLSLYSSSIGHNDFLNFQKQIIFAVLAIIFMILASFIDWRILRNDPYLIAVLYLLGCIGLAGLLFFAPEIRAVRGWYKVGPVSIDPIEFVKIVLIALLAKYFSLRHAEVYRIRHILLSGFYVLVPSVLIFLQPDFGRVLIISILWLAVLLVSGIKLKPFLILILVLLIITGIGWSFLLQEYQKERILSFVLPQFEPLGAGWSRQQARIAIGSGGLFGQGFAQGSQTQYGFLPEPQTDFIFSALAEEFGLLGVSVVLILFLILLARIIKIALNSQTNFYR